MKRLLCLLFCNFALTAASAQTTAASDPATLVHTVRRGESLEFLATRFGVTPGQLSALNHDADAFYAGMRITLPFPHELRGKSDGTTPLDDDILSELYRYRDLCIEADSLFAHSSFSSAHDRYDEAIRHFDGYFDCSGAKYARAVCSYHAHDWETALQEFDRVISSTSCSEDVLAVAKAYREECSEHEEQIRQRRYAAEEARKERRRERWRNIGAGLVQAAGMVAQAYVQSKYEMSGGEGYASSGDLTAGLDPASPGYASAVAARSSVRDTPPEAFNPDRVAAMARPVYSFDSNGNMMVSFPGLAQAEADMNAAVQQALGGSNPAFSASLNRMSALSQQFWSTPMYPEAWAESSSSSSSSTSSPSSTSSSSSFSTFSSSSSSGSTAGSGGATPATRGKLCQKMSAGDNAHCGGNGVCSRCNGNKRYYDTSFGNARWVPCGTCGQTGKCPSCHGTGYRN